MAWVRQWFADRLQPDSDSPPPAVTSVSAELDALGRRDADIARRLRVLEAQAGIQRAGSRGRHAH